MNYVELHIGDYDKATAHLTACEDGMYGRLLRWYYDSEEALPPDIKAIQRRVRARSRDEKEAVETVLEEFFQITDDGWHHKRCDEEIAKYQDKREKAKRSAEARWNGKRADSERTTNADADGMRTHSEGNAHQSPVTRHHQKQEPSLPSSAARQPARPPASADDDAPVPGEQDLPSWVPRSLWREFYRHRAVIRKPLSIPGQRQVVQRLIELSEAGHDIASSLRQTMAAGLAIPVEPRNQATGPPNSQRQAGSKTINAVKTLQGLKADETLPTRMAAERNPGRLIEARDAES